jgi:hypothetical protein
MLRRVALVRTNISEEFISSIIRVTRFVELGTMLIITSNRHMLRRNTDDAIPHSHRRENLKSYFRSRILHTYEQDCIDISMYLEIIVKKKTPWPLVRERTIPTDRPPLVDEI